MKEVVRIAAYFTATGNPFVDAGVYAMMVWTGKREPEEITLQDIGEMVEALKKVYFSEEWKKSLYSVFPNNSVTHPRIASPEKFEETMQELIKKLKPLESKGYCTVCGRRDVSRIAIYKDKIPLIGSGELLNFFPAGKTGLDLCPGCVLAVQFMPLLLQKCGQGMFSLLHTGYSRFMRTWARMCGHDIEVQVSTGSFTGPRTWQHNPRSALLEAVMSIINEFGEEIEDKSITINLYHFTNYNQGPALAIYQLPAKVFLFLIKLTRAGLKRQWLNQIVARGYSKNKKGEINTYANSVYDRLLEGVSIVSYFVDYQERKAVGDWELLKVYLKEVVGMEPSRIEGIRGIGDALAKIIKTANKQKRLFDLERTKSYNEILQVLLLIGKDGIKHGILPITYDDLLNVLFPEGPLGWKDTKYLLLFRIYEQLADWLPKDVIQADELTEEED